LRQAYDYWQDQPGNYHFAHWVQVAARAEAHALPDNLIGLGFTGKKKLVKHLNATGLTL